jgi:hypothetical protein
MKLPLRHRGRRRSSSRCGVLPRHRRPEIEALDPRIAPALTITPSGNVLSIVSDDAPDVASVRILGLANQSTLVLGVFNSANGSGAPISAPILTSPGPTIPILAIASIRFTGNGGADSFTNFTTVPSVFNGGLGDDTFTGGSGTDTVVGAGDTNWVLSNTNLTGQGTDTLASVEAAQFTGGPGANTLDARNFTRPVTFDGAGGADNLLGGAGNDTFIVRAGNETIDGGTGTNTLQVQANSSITLTDTSLVSALGTDALSRIQRASVTGGPGNDILDAFGFSGAATLAGGAGNDLLQGGAGIDSLAGGDGDDVLVRSPGNDVLSGNAGTNKVFGLANGTLTPANLTATGNLAVALAGNRLIVAGPTGAGFTIVGNWTRTTAPGSVAGFLSETFSASGTLTLKTATGDLAFPVPAAAPVTFTTAADTFTNFGTVSAISWDNGPGLDLTGVGKALSSLGSQFGINLVTPTITWGLRLGRDLGFLQAPLNNAVPYIFFTVSSYSLNIGGNSVVDGHPLTVVYDPSDPFIFVGLAQPVPGFPLGVAFGASMKGRIPFTPAQTIANAPAIFGHAFGRGTVTIPLSGATATLQGDTVLDLDANRDGTFVNLNGQAVSRFFFGLPLPGPLGDLRYGSNSTLTLSAQVPQLPFLGTLTLPVASATSILTPDLLAFQGSTINPLQNTPLSFIKPAISVTVSGSIQSNGSFAFHLGITRGSFFLFPTSNQFIDITNNSIAASMDLISLPFFGTLNVSGAIDGAGHVTLTGAVDNELVPQPNIVSLTTHTAITLSNATGSPSVTGTVGGGFVNGLQDFADLHGSLTLSVTITASTSGLSITGTGTAVAGVTLPILGPVNVTGTVTVSASGVVIAWSPPLLPTLTFPFNNAPAFANRTVTASAAAGDPVSVSGTIAEADPEDEFFLDVNWGDGSPVETFHFPAGSNGQPVTVTHRYEPRNRAGSPSNDYPIVLVWRDPHGAGNTDVLSTTITNTPLTSTERFVNALYHELLQRDAEDTGLAAWSGAIDAGTTRADVVRQIEDSAEYRTRLVQTAYQTLLQRDVDPSGLSFWTGRLAAGAGADAVRIGIFGSDEYFQLHAAGTNGGFLTAVYRDALGRALDATGEIAWQTLLVGGTSRETVARKIATSLEAEQDSVRDFYRAYLGRDPEQPGLEFWTGQLQHGATEQAVLAAIAGSDEFFARLGQAPLDTPPALPTFATTTNADSTTTSAVITVEGRSDPDVRVTLGEQTVFADATGRFRFTNVPLDVGENTLLATATNAAGLSSSFEVVVTRTEE